MNTIEEASGTVGYISISRTISYTYVYCDVVCDFALVCWSEDINEYGFVVGDEVD